MSFEQTQSQQRNFEQNTLVWFNENIKNENEINNIKAKLRSIINYLRIFDDIDECIDYISSNETERIYFIITSSSANIIIPCIDEIEQIKMIYIFTLDKLQINVSKKSIGIHNILLSLCDAIKNDVSFKKLTYNSSDLDFSSLSSSTKNRSNRQEAAFIYFRLLTENLVGLKHKQSTRDEFISFCRQQYDGNKFEIEKIEEFQRTYSKKNAICWYTRDSFLYRILNNALRSQDIEILYQLGFFIADLYCELESLCITQLKSSTLPSIVYRGQFMAKHEFDNKIRNNIGGFLSINSFFSTSVNKQVALMFTNTSSINQPNIESILFEITIDFQKCQRPIADIKQFSYMHEEDEILFSMGTVFRIKSVERSNSHNIWIVDLLMNGEEDEKLKSISDSFKATADSLDNLNTFAHILLIIGEYEKAKQFMLILIKDIPPNNSNQLALYYSNLLTICNDQKNYVEGLGWAEKALQLLPDKPHILTSIYVNAGNSHVGENNFASAIDCFHKVIDGCQKKSTLEDQKKLGIAYSNLGLLYIKKGDNSTALKHLLEACDIMENILPHENSKLAITFRFIGSVYYFRNDYQSALIYLFKAAEIQERTLPENHPCLPDTYIMIGMCYSDNTNYEEADKYFQKFSQIIDTLPIHTYYSNNLHSIAQTYLKQKRYSEALHYFHKSLDIEIKLPLPTDSLLIDLYFYISSMYCLQADYISSIDYCQKAIPIALKCNDEKLVAFYNTITGSFIFLRDIKQATHYAKLALDFGNAMLSPNHTFMNTVNLNASLLLPPRRSFQ